MPIPKRLPQSKVVVNGRKAGKGRAPTVAKAYRPPPPPPPPQDPATIPPGELTDEQLVEALASQSQATREERVRYRALRDELRGRRQT
jgi:hypothetical protein